MQENLENLDECLEDGSAEWTLIYNAQANCAKETISGMYNCLKEMGEAAKALPNVVK